MHLINVPHQIVKIYEVFFFSRKNDEVTLTINLGGS